VIGLLVLVGALAVDRWYGEWPDRLHPVVWMGKAIRWLERWAPRGGAWAQFTYGLGMALAVPGACTALASGIERVPVLDLVGGIWLLKGCMAIRMLGAAGLAVASALERGDLDGARLGLRSLCSRDATTLTEGQVAAGATESIAENASDSFVAPLFWYVLFGLPGAAYYRAANTLDSMVGYHGKYEWLGKASARQDDLLNVVPARITVMLLVLAGALVGEDWGRGLRVMWRDRKNTESPNAGWPMAAMAGLLGVVLEKPGHYRLGDGAEADAGAIRRGWRVVRVASVLGVVGAVAIVAVRVPSWPWPWCPPEPVAFRDRGDHRVAMDSVAPPIPADLAVAGSDLTDDEALEIALPEQRAARHGR
jgi:adenosylcobinamide-phosphate synthase